MKMTKYSGKGRVSMQPIGHLPPAPSQGGGAAGAPVFRHCERSEAIQHIYHSWIASGYALAMTKRWRGSQLEIRN
jgi:hypothetical protein